MEANTLRPEELRIGNYLFDKNNKICQVQDVSLNRIYAPSVEGIGTFLPFKPIPLSEDILLKLGFKKDEYDIARPMYYTYKGFRLNCNIGFLTLNNSNELADFKPIELKYLHQIQNLFHSLTGEELTIKE